MDNAPFAWQSCLLPTGLFQTTASATELTTIRAWGRQLSRMNQQSLDTPRAGVAQSTRALDNWRARIITQSYQLMLSVIPTTKTSIQVVHSAILLRLGIWCRMRLFQVRGCQRPTFPQSSTSYATASDWKAVPPSIQQPEKDVFRVENNNDDTPIPCSNSSHDSRRNN